MKLILPIMALAFLSMGADDCDPNSGPQAHYNCARGYSFYHKLAPGEDYQCPKEYNQEQVWRDVGIGLTRAPTDLVECTCKPTYY